MTFKGGSNYNHGELRQPLSEGYFEAYCQKCGWIDADGCYTIASLCNFWNEHNNRHNFDPLYHENIEKEKRQMEDPNYPDQPKIGFEALIVSSEHDEIS